MKTHTITARQFKLQVRPHFPHDGTYSAYWVATIEGKAMGLLCGNSACHPHSTSMAAYIATTNWASGKKVAVVAQPLDEILHSLTPKPTPPSIRIGGVRIEYQPNL